jgi:3-hydroxyacyl-CoA dehydrogenase
MSGEPITTVAVIGTGVIGAGWISKFLSVGLDVVAWDPAADAEAKVRAAIDSHWTVLERVGLATGASPDRVRFVDDPDEAVAVADFVQENGPEVEDLKVQLFARLDAATRADVVIASSSSGLLPSVIQRECQQHPERVLVGHPFSPAHLIPLVEVVPGRQTSQLAVDTAMAFYTSIGKRPIHVRVELPGHVTNRLQAALWREAYSLVASGAATVADVDTAISNGPGLRWALLGPFATQHLAGGEGGIAHVLEHLGPPMVAWWETLHSPAWTDELKSKVVAGVDAELSAIDQTSMVAERDALLERLLIAKANAQNLPSS